MPARWVNHSAVDPHASSLFATPRACTSASTEASTAARCARSFSAPTTASTSSPEDLATHIVSSNSDQTRRRSEHPGGGGRRTGGLLHDPTQPETTDSQGR